MGKRKILFPIFFLISFVLCFGLFSTSNVVFAEDGLTIKGMALEATIVGANFDKNSRELVVDFVLKNTTDNFISGVSYNLAAFKGDKFIKEGDPFASMEFVFSITGNLGDLYPRQEKTFQIKTIPPEKIDSANYYFKFDLYDTLFNHFGATLTETPLTLTGKGGYLGGIKETYFRTRNGDNDRLFGFLVDKLDPASIIIPFDKNEKIIEYAEKNEVYANVFFAKVAKLDYPVKTYTKEKLNIVIENGKKIIKYDMKPWPNMESAPYNVNFTIVDKNGNKIVESANYRWWVAGFYARIKSLYANKNLYGKGEKLNIQLSTIIYDLLGEKKDIIGEINLKMTSVNDRVFSFSKDVSLTENSTVIFKDESFSEETIIKKIDVLFLEKDNGKILDSLTFNFSAEKKVGSKIDDFNFDKNLCYYYLILFAVCLLLIIIFKSKDARIILIICAIISLTAFFLSYSYVNAYADWSLPTSVQIVNFSYNCQYINFIVLCDPCFNGYQNLRYVWKVDEVGGGGTEHLYTYSIYINYLFFAPAKRIDPYASATVWGNAIVNGWGGCEGEASQGGTFYCPGGGGGGGGGSSTPVCGTANGQNFRDAPQNNLCSTGGTGGAYSSGLLWKWECVLSSQVVSCYANRILNGVCGPSNDGSSRWDNFYTAPQKGFCNEGTVFNFPGLTTISDVSHGYSNTAAVPGDYDGDGKWDLAVYDANAVPQGKWYIRKVFGPNATIANITDFGFPGTVPVSGDYDGDGKWDLALYETATGKWYIRKVSGPKIGAWPRQHGSSSMIPVPGDYDGDGKWDLAVYDASQGKWYIRKVLSSADPYIGPSTGINFGHTGAVAVPGDYDGDGKWDLAVYDTNAGRWYIRKVLGSDPGIADIQNFGLSNTVAVPGDYDGDGISDLALYNSSQGRWTIRRISGFGIGTELQLGYSSAVPVWGDYNGDKNSDLAVYDASQGKWYIRSLKTGPWTWKCKGNAGGTDSPQCSANKITDGICGPAATEYEDE